MLAGCAEYRSDPLSPAAELEALRAPRYEEVRIERVVAPSEHGPFDPNDGFDESELVAIALSLDPELRVRRLAIGESEALLIGAGLWPNPEFSASLRPGIGAASGLSVGLDVLFEALRGDLRAARIAVAESRLEAERASIAADEYRVAAATRKAHVAVLAAEHIARSLEGEAELRGRSIELVRERRRLGEATEFDVSAVELERVDIDRTLREARFEVESRRRALLRIVGLPPATELTLTLSGAPLSASLAAVPSADEIDARILANRLDLHAAELVHRVAEAELRVAIEEQVPKLAIGPSYECELEGASSLGLGASVELPLFDRNQADIAAKTAARNVARAKYSALLHGLRAAAFDARAALLRARAEIETQERDIVPLVDRYERLFEQSFAAGESSVFEWLAVRGRALDARRGFVRAVVAHAEALADLEATIGASLPAVDSTTPIREGK